MTTASIAAIVSLALTVGSAITHFVLRNRFMILIKNSNPTLWKELDAAAGTTGPWSRWNWYSKVYNGSLQLSQGDPLLRLKAPIAFWGLFTVVLAVLSLYLSSRAWN